MKTKYCTNCGEPLTNIAMFCNKCGAFQREVKPKDLENSDPKSELESFCEEKNGDAEKQTEVKSVFEAKSVAFAGDYPCGKAAARFFTKFISIILSVVFCAVLLSASLLGTVRGTFDPRMIVRSFASVKVDDIKNITVEDSRGREIPVSKVILDACGNEIKEKYGLDENKIVNVLDDAGAGEFIGEVVGDYTAYVLGTEELRELDGARVVKWLRENEGTIEKTLNYDIKEEDYKSLEQQIDKSELVRSLSKTQIEREVGVLELEMVKTALSAGVYASVIAFACLIATVIVVINRRKLHAVFAYVTPSFAAVGGFFIVLYMGLKFAVSPDILSDIAGSDIVSIMASPFIMPVLIRGIVMLAVGIIPAVIYKIVCKRKGIKA